MKYYFTVAMMLSGAGGCPLSVEMADIQTAMMGKAFSFAFE
ncbi:putative lipoprotein [Brucella lupini]|uniref:Putative lipoprotein n=1 Tax=Brucella lupini TaxID=255457 RepID=A0A256GFS1_9HYPH|nr:putative lipoprotein [Brucella lupini]